MFAQLAPDATDPGQDSTDDLDELARQIAELASHIYAGTCRWLELVAWELDPVPSQPNGDPVALARRNAGAGIAVGGGPASTARASAWTWGSRSRR